MNSLRQCACLLFCVAGFSGCLGGYREGSLERAERLLREEKYDQAIATYRDHMDRRLSVTGRPEWENPYFYLLLIGDVHLGREEVARALECYDEAARQGIHSSLISDRYRSVARHYEEKQQLKEAFELLRRHRELDTLLFDAMLDRIGKSITEQENEALKREAKTSK